MNKNGSTLNPSSNQFDGRLFYLSKQVPHYFTITFMTLADYNHYHSHLNLKSNEIAVNTDNSLLSKTNKIEINGTVYKVKHIKNEYQYFR